METEGILNSSMETEGIPKEGSSEEPAQTQSVIAAQTQRFTAAQTQSVSVRKRNMQKKKQNGGALE